MENRSVRLNPLGVRRQRRQLVQFFDLVGLYLQAGYDLSFAWPEAAKETFAGLEPRPVEGLHHCLRRLGTEYPDPRHRLWFSLIADLYEEGAGLRDAVESIASTLRQEQGRELETHCRELPIRANVVLLLFFFPPSVLLLFAPLLLEILKAFPR